MMQKAFILAVILAGSAFCVAPGLAQEEMRTVDSSAFSKASRTPALFAHDRHNEDAEIDDCGTCHHVFVDGRRSGSQTSEDRPCSDCHAPLAAEDNPIPLRRAFHLRCKGCHLLRNAGPILCAGCHPRRQGG